MTNPSEQSIDSTEPNKYWLRLEKAQRLANYGDLSSENQQMIALLAIDKDLDLFDFNEIVNEELSKVRQAIRSQKFADTAFSAVGATVESQPEPFMPRSFDEAKVMGRHTYEDFISGSNYSENNPDDRAFYTSDALQKHMTRLHAMSDKYRQYARGNKAIERQLAQRNDGGLWVEHHSLALVKEKNTSDDAVARIYLNPKLQDSFDIYQEIFLEANRQGLRFQSKVFDPSWYGTKDVMETVRDAHSDGRTQRRDPIVFYGFEESKDQLLVIVENVYAKHASSFVGRETGAVPMPIADGIAIGDNVTSRDTLGIKESLTTHRENVFYSMPKNLSPVAQKQYLRDRHVNPENIAFNV